MSLEVLLLQRPLLIYRVFYFDSIGRPLLFQRCFCLHKSGGRHYFKGILLFNLESGRFSFRNILIFTCKGGRFYFQGIILFTLEGGRPNFKGILLERPLLFQRLLAFNPIAHLQSLHGSRSHFYFLSKRAAALNYKVFHFDGRSYLIGNLGIFTLEGGRCYIKGILDGGRSYFKGSRFLFQ
jgi:hypothetical protein